MIEQIACRLNGGAEDWMTLGKRLCRAIVRPAIRRFTTARPLCLAFVGALSFPAIPLFAQCQYQFANLADPIAPPAYTVARGVNDNGDVVGEVHSSRWQGFFLSSDLSSYTNFDVAQPPRETFPNGINIDERIVGHFTDDTGTAHGFLSNSDGSSVTTFDVPGNHQATQAYGINDNGETVGWFHDATGPGLGLHAFWRSSDGSSFTIIDEPNTDRVSTMAFGINNSGQIVGSFDDATAYHGFVRSADGSDYSTIDDPSSTFGTAAYGINNNGDIVGVYNFNQGYRVFVLTSDGAYTDVVDPDVPDGFYSYVTAYGINDGGQIVGYRSIDGTTATASAFIATPVCDQSSMRPSKSPQ
jgi:hypothetical protein